ncbi:MAG TPA: T9SS type A sorting domain-containing protein [Candidatus Kryptonia bacterium]
MKSAIISLLLIAVVSLATVPSASFAAQGADTVIVSALPPGNLNNFINADTVASGLVKPNTVFLLKPTGALDTVYYMTAPVSAKGSVTIVGYINPTTGHPPVVAPSIAEDNSSIGYFFNPQGNDTLTLKGLYFLGTRTDSVAFTGRFVLPAGDSDVYIFDRCILENISGAGTPNLFDTYNHDHESFYVTNCEFRNNQDDNPQNPGFAWVDPGTYPCDTAIFKNNTFFLTGGYVLGSSGYGCAYLDFEHNTIFISGEGGAFDLYQMTNTVIKNNIFFSVSSTAYPASWYNNTPGSWGSSLIPIDSLRSLVGSPYDLTEAARHITITNNAYFWPQQIVNNWMQYKGGAWASDSLHWPTFINTQPGMLTNTTAWPNINVANNDSVDPGFNSALVTLAAGKMVAFVDTCWNNGGTGQGIRPYVYSLYNPPSLTGDWPGVASNWATTQGYPVPENLRYSGSLTGSDGKHLGDLNWFPEELAVRQIPNVIPTQFDLSQNFPNPFNPTTTIKVSLTHSGAMSLTIYNVLGQVVQVVDQGNRVAGEYVYNVSLDKFASGVYFYTLRQGTNSITRKMLLLK